MFNRTSLFAGQKRWTTLLDIIRLSLLRQTSCHITSPKDCTLVKRANLLNAADIRRICDKNNSRDHVSHFYFSFSIPASCSKTSPTASAIKTAIGCFLGRSLRPVSHHDSGTPCKRVPTTALEKGPQAPHRPQRPTTYERLSPTLMPFFFRLVFVISDEAIALKVILMGQGYSF